MDTSTKGTSRTSAPPASAPRAHAKLTSCPQCPGDVVATPMTRARPDGTREVWAWACPLHGGPLPLH